MLQEERKLCIVVKCRSPADQEKHTVSCNPFLAASTQTKNGKCFCDLSFPALGTQRSLDEAFSDRDSLCAFHWVSQYCCIFKALHPR